MKSDNIVFFDGVCNLCNRTIDFLIRNDRNNKLKFSSLQSSFGQKFLKDNELKMTEFDSVVYFKNRKIYMKSSAFIELMKDLGAQYRWLSILRFIPIDIRDFIYDKIAKNRYSFFGKKHICRIPTEDERQRFLE